MKLNQPLIISLLIHICIYMLALLLPNKPQMPPRMQPIEVVYQNDTKSKPQQIVSQPDEQNKLEDSLKELKERVQFLSQVTKRVKKEMVAQQSGKTQNRKQNSPLQNDTEQASSQRQQQTSRRQTLPKLDAKSFDPSAPSIDKPMPDRVAKNTRLGDSTIAEYIPDVQAGGFTALNTDQFIYYTFYARTNEQIRNRWVNNVREFLNQNPQTAINRLALREQLTQLEIILNPQGHFVKALVHLHSDSVGLDQSAIQAFKSAAPLNNPPSEIIEPDGFIHLHYGFHIQFRPRFMAEGTAGQ